MKSSVPGLVYPVARNDLLKTSVGYLKGRSKQDGAEGLWRIRDGLYDLESFAKSHPGGAEWIHLTKNTDITELFESHHITDKAERILPKFYIREATKPRAIPLTFKPDGFYRKFKKRAAEALKDVDFHHPARITNLMADALFICTFAFSLTAAYNQSFFMAIVAAIFLTWTTVSGHNYFHMRDNFRMYYFDLSIMSSKEWRVTHAMSHHMYPNTLWDHEIYGLQPFLNWLPDTRKSVLKGLVSKFITPIIYACVYIALGMKRYYLAITEYGYIEFRDVVPFILPAAMCTVAPSISVALKTWLTIIIHSSFFFGCLGFNAAHHHPDIFHDGDIYRDDLDWGLLELDAVRDRKIIDEVPFLVLTSFGSHTLHHLLPTVDHHYLPLAAPALLQTCEEFGIKNDQWTIWELVKGQFRQLSRNQPRKNYR